MAPSSPDPTNLDGKRAVVVGAGPSGAVAAIHLARAGFEVDVYERTQAHTVGMNLTGAVGPRSYDVVLGRRGVAALEGAGVSTPDTDFLPLPKIARYVKGKGNKPSHNPASRYARVVNRGTLAGHLISEAIRQHPGRIHVHFSAELEDVSLDQRQAVFLNADGARETIMYDLLVACDGASSRVRMAMQQQVPGFTCTQLWDDMEYKAFYLASLEHADPGFHKFLIVLVDAATNSSIIATPSANASPRAVYIANQGFHASMRGVEDYVKAMKASFPYFLEDQYSAMAAQLVAAAVSTGGANTRCSQLHGPSVVLVGDAGHSMWPTMGQGANSALESAAVLGALLRECKDLSALPERYNAVRHADALAVVELTQRGFGGRRKRNMTSNNFGMIKLIGQMVLHKAAPRLVPKPVLMTLNDTLNRYTELLCASEQHNRVANILLLCMAAVVVLSLLAVAGVMLR